MAAQANTSRSQEPPASLSHSHTPAASGHLRFSQPSRASYGRYKQNVSPALHQLRSYDGREVTSSDDSNRYMGLRSPFEKSLSTWDMICLTISMGGAQLTWTLELAYGTPFLLSLGLSKELTSLVWLAGPISGLVAQPVIGSISDSSNSRYRRRFHIAMSGFLVALSTLLIAFSIEVSTVIVDLLGGGQGDWDPSRKEYIKHWARAIAIVNFYVLDFSLNALQAICRALILDRAPAEQQNQANAWHGRMTHAGNIIGFTFGWLDLSQWEALAFLGGGQFRKLCLVAIIFLAISLAITCWTQDEGENLAARRNRGGKSKFVEIFENIWDTIRHLPRPIRRVCAVQFFAFMGWFPFLFYSTTFIAEIMTNQLRHPPDPDVATEKGSFALLLYSIVAMIVGIFLPYMADDEDVAASPSEYPDVASQPTEGAASVDGDATQNDSSTLPAETTAKTPLLRKTTRKAMSWKAKVQRYFTLRNIWTGGQLVFFVVMLSTFFVTTVEGATAVIALVGVSWAVAAWVPFALVMEFAKEHREGTSPYEFDDDDSISSSERGHRPAYASASAAAETSTARHQLQRALGDCREPLIRRESSPNSSRRRRRSGSDVEGWSDSGELAASGGEEEGGTILGVHNLSVVVPQFIVAIVASVIFRLAKTTTKPLPPPPHAPSSEAFTPETGVGWVLRFGGIMSLVAAIITRWVPPTRVERERMGRWRMRRWSGLDPSDGEDEDGDGRSR